MSDTEPYENPLMPNKKLQEIFVAMAEMRVLDEHITSQQRGVKARQRLRSTRGQEAVRVSMAIRLEAGDLVSDAQQSVAMDLLAGAKIDSVLRRVADLTAAGKDRFVAPSDNGRQLPWVEGAEARMQMAMGAALAFNALKKTDIVVAFAWREEVSNKFWRRMLTLASRLEMPIIFVVLPGQRDKKAGRKSLSAKARSYGVPGFPVEASDAVALYRVAQESIARTRGGGGPVLVECVEYRMAGERKRKVDPVLLMRGFLLGRRICNEQWLDRAENRLFRRLQGAKG